MKVVQVCDTCRHSHVLDFDPLIGAGAAFSDWLNKHPFHEIRLLRPDRSPKLFRARPLWPKQTRSALSAPWDDEVKAYKAGWLDYLDNADVKVAYAASAAVTITLASLAASSTLLAGRESTAVDNGASNKYLDELLAGFLRTGAANLQAGTIQVAVVGNIDDTPTWPDVFDGTDSVETVSVQAMYDQVCRVISSIATDTTQRIWPFGPTSVASMFGGVMPDQYVVFVSHNAHTSTNVWSATESDHGIKRTPVYATVT